MTTARQLTEATAQTPDPSAPRDEIDLTADDEAALDTAWSRVTDAEIEASIQWLDESDDETDA